MPSGVRVQVSPGLPTISMRRVWAIGSPAVPKTAAPQGHRSSNLLPSATFTSGCSWESSLIANQAHGVRILIPVPRRARQMVSQHIAKVPSARARLGSIPRLSAKVFYVWVSGGYGWPRLPVEQSAPSERERPGSNAGTPTKRGNAPTYALVQKYSARMSEAVS